MTDPAEAAAFCDPRLTNLHDPTGLPDLSRAAERLVEALRREEPVVIWGDYDVDGVTASAILRRTFRAIAPDAPVRVFIPHRIDDGYGLHAEGVRRLAREGAKVIVSVDCGITAVEPAHAALACGVDLIITDHHTPPARIEDLPDAFAVVHPGRPDSTYPFHDLTGAGVAYKLAWRAATIAAGSQRVGESMRALLVDLLAFAAMGTIADVAPLVDENRVIVKYGLARIKATPFVGLRALIQASDLAGETVASDDVGFRLAPRINACGRLGHARDALELLLTDDPARATSLAAAMTRLNDERRRTERAITAHAATRAEEAGMTREDCRAIVLADAQWHAGVIGVACSRLIGRFHRPTVLLTRSGDECHGSCRSIEGYDIHEALAACSEHLRTFGGHAMAAGLSLSETSLDAFTRAFTAHANEHLTPADLVPTLTIDCETTLSQLDVRSVQRLGSLAPFGRGNPNPSVLIRDARIEEPPRPLGADGQHLKITLRQGDRAVRVLAWGWGARRSQIRPGQIVDAVVEPSLNSWRGVVTVEPTLKDLGLREG